MTDKNLVYKRLKIQSWRRGMKEMDLILGKFSDFCLRELNEKQLEAYESLMLENDQTLFSWFSKQAPVPVDFVDIVEMISKTIETKV